MSLGFAAPKGPVFGCSELPELPALLYSATPIEVEDLAEIVEIVE